MFTNEQLADFGVKETDCVKRNKPTVAGYYKLKWGGGYSKQEEIGWYDAGCIGLVHMPGGVGQYTLSSFEYVIGPLPVTNLNSPSIPSISKSRPIVPGYYYVTWKDAPSGRCETEIAWWDGKGAAFKIIGWEAAYDRVAFKKIVGPIDMSDLGGAEVVKDLLKELPGTRPLPTVSGRYQVKWKKAPRWKSDSVLSEGDYKETNPHLIYITGHGPYELSNFEWFLNLDQLGLTDKDTKENPPVINYAPQKPPAPVAAPAPAKMLPSMEKVAEEEALGLVERGEENQKKLDNHKEQISKGILMRARNGDQKITDYYGASHREAVHLVKWVNSQDGYHAESLGTFRSPLLRISIKTPRQWPRFLHCLIFWRPRT